MVFSIPEIKRIALISESITDSPIGTGKGSIVYDDGEE